tara:strand:- start:159 stop:425 length:267 start_codon:yes stop_codon:yes gene_type:complete
MHLAKAIAAINPNAVWTLNGDDLNDIQWLDDTTPIAVSDIETKIDEVTIVENNKVIAKTNAKVSGNTKLLDLGLTQAEATALTGYTPE